MRDIIDLWLQWVPGHKDFEPNECVDQEAKKAAQGYLSPWKDLPKFLQKLLPISVSALHQEVNASIQRHWVHQWKASPHYNHLWSIDNSVLLKKFLKLTSPLSHRQSSLLMQLQTSHIGLNQWLFKIQCLDTPTCPHYQGITVETVCHLLFKCPQYCWEHHIFDTTLRRKARDLSYILLHPNTMLSLLHYIHLTERLKATFGAVASPTWVHSQSVLILKLGNKPTWEPPQTLQDFC